MGILETLGEILGAPQQALFQGASRGSERFGSGMSELTQAGLPGYLAAPVAGAMSLPEFLRGMAGGITGTGERVSGADLAGGNEYLGTALDLAADPLAVISGAGGRAPGLIRTFRNAREISNPAQRAIWNNLGWRKLLADIPKAPAAGEPLFMRHGGLAPGIPGGAQKAMGARVSSPGASGMLSKFGDVVGTVRGAGPKSTVHELTHRGYAQAPGRVFREAERLNETAPRSLMRRLGRDYGDTPIDEAAAWLSESNAIPSNLPLLNRIQRDAWSMTPRAGLPEYAERAALAPPASRIGLDWWNSE